MKFSKFLLSAACALSLGSLASCQSDDEPKMESGNVIGKDQVAYTVDMKLPDEFRTRAAASGSVGTDGLYTFSREIDRAWYAVYYDNQLLYTSEQPLMEQCVKQGDGFSLLLKFHKDLDPTKIYIFFWAGNKQDNVTCNNTNVTSGINLNFADRCVTVDPKYMNGNNAALQEYDSFSGYFQLSPSKDVSSYKLKFTLKRPFCQIHILSDEFVYPGVYTAFPNGFTVVPGFGRNAANTSNYTSELVSPTTWYFDGSIVSNPVMRQNEYNYTLTNYEFTNRLTKQTPERVTFNGRLMDYMGCYYVFAPPVKQPLKGAVSSGNTATYTKLNIALRKVGQTLGQSEFMSVTLPVDGLKANERYVVYNKVSNPGPGGEGDGDDDNPGGGGGDPNKPGGGGFFSDTYNFEIVTNPVWDNTINKDI